QIARLAYEAREAGSAMTVSAGGVVAGRWDRLWIEQAVQNLLSNAIQYGNGNPIEVSICAHGEFARVCVRDHGIGIPEDAQAIVFERFERLAPVRHRGGFGLGLWIVRQIAEAHEGRVTLVSRPGEGSAFTLDLPLRAGAKERLV